MRGAVLEGGPPAFSWRIASAEAGWHTDIGDFWYVPDPGHRKIMVPKLGNSHFTDAGVFNMNAEIE